MVIKTTQKDIAMDKLRGRKEVYKIPIDPEGKQILILRGANIPVKDFEEFVNTVQTWAKSNDPILVAQVSANVEIQLVRSRKHGR
jgi:hypothetical protein